VRVKRLRKNKIKLEHICEEKREEEVRIGDRPLVLDFTTGDGDDRLNQREWV
jgi:hypothetical protein